MRKIIVPVLLFIFASSFALSQDDGLAKAKNEKNNLGNVPQDVTSKCAIFFKSLIASNVEKAFEDILKTSPIIKKDEQVKSLVQQTKRSISLYGQIKGYEPVSSEVASESLLRVRYIALHSDFPMRWVFTFYKSPEKNWIVVNIKFDDLSEYFFSDE